MAITTLQYQTLPSVAAAVQLYKLSSYITPKNTGCGCSDVLSHPLLSHPLIYHTPQTHKTDPGNYRGITLLNTVGKVFCKLLNDRMVGVLEKERRISEGQAGFRKERGCVDHVFTVGRIIQGRKKEEEPTYCFFLDVQKAYDTV